MRLDFRSVGGEAGVRHAIDLLAAEIFRDLAMLGAVRLDELDPGWLLRL